MSTHVESAKKKSSVVFLLVATLFIFISVILNIVILTRDVVRREYLTSLSTATTFSESRTKLEELGARVTPVTEEGFSAQFLDTSSNLIVLLEFESGTLAFGKIYVGSESISGPPFLEIPIPNGLQLAFIIVLRTIWANAIASVLAILNYRRSREYSYLDFLSHSVHWLFFSWNGALLFS